MSLRKDRKNVAKIAIYKRGQGKYTRVATFIAAMVIIVVGAIALSGKLSGYDSTKWPPIRFGVPVAVVAVLTFLMFWIVNRPKSADFLIATEGEMKKVSWSSRKEIIGSTKVVIVTTFLMAGILFFVDILFQVVFAKMGVIGSSSGT
jgi:preprotein translocase subunit SecE